jgi:hypothetical protein
MTSGQVTPANPCQPSAEDERWAREVVEFISEGVSFKMTAPTDLDDAFRRMVALMNLGAAWRTAAHTRTTSPPSVRRVVHRDANNLIVPIDDVPLATPAR